jgi:hypothetical protein
LYADDASDKYNVQIVSFYKLDWSSAMTLGLRQLRYFAAIVDAGARSRGPPNG